MTKELKLFLRDKYYFKEKFNKFMDLLISNQPDTILEPLLFYIINYIQIISCFYSEQIQVFKPKNNKSDMFLYNIEVIFRIKDIFKNNYKGIVVVEYCFLVAIILGITYFLIICSRTKPNSIYSFHKYINNYTIKIFLYVGYNMVLDICFSHFCFGFTENNPNFEEEVKCKGKDKILIFVISIILIILAFSLHIFLQFFYSDSFFLSNSSYCKMITNYELYMDLNCLFNSILLTQAYFLTKEFFIIYNLIASIFLLHYFIKHYLYYRACINISAGIFHLLYLWTSIFCLLFAYIHFSGKGIIYIISCIIVSSYYFKIKKIIEKDIFYSIPITKFNNINYLLYFLKVFINKIIKSKDKSENKAFISGIIQILIDECDNSKCKELINGEIYLPSEDEWRSEKKKNVDDMVFLKYFVVILFNYILYNEYSSPEIYFNLSLYYLIVINNHCEAMYYCQRITELKLNLRQRFTFERLKLKISEALIEKLKPSSEPNVNLENINIAIYYKYDALSRNFIEEINNDIELSLEFWNIFKKSLKDPNFIINYDKIFNMTEKIQITKNKIEKMWKELLGIYSGVNEYFEFYNDYIEQINDDDLKKRDLDSIKKKAINFIEHLNHNYYSILFDKDTGIMIVNGDKGSEGVIKQCNKRIELIFNYNAYELKEINVNKLMPKLYDKKHSKYIEKYFRTGYKKYTEKKDFKTFGKDRNNAIIQIKIALKLLPVLNYNVFFVSLIKKENINDIILTDENFNIQGMSSKLMQLLNITNIFLFQETNIPFYVICKKFINFYSIFMRTEKNNDSQLIKKKTIFSEKEKQDNLKMAEERDIAEQKEDSNGNEIHENIEINENIELEFEIKLPKFLINFSNKVNFGIFNNIQNALSIIAESKENSSEDESLIDNDSDDELNDNENELLVDSNSRNTKILESFYQKNISNHNTLGENTLTLTPTPAPTPTPESPKWNSEKVKFAKTQLKKINKKLEEEKIYLEKIEEYRNLFKEEKYEDLEDLIDTCNKDSPFSEYKFNFTFDKYKYGDNEMGYIIRCIDNRSQEGLSEEKSIEFDSKAAKYKKEKAESIKPLFELLENERQEIINLPEIFLKLSLENEKFQELLNVCKNEITKMSKIQGQKKLEILDDDNSSQSHSGFDTRLVKKNRIEEIRSNLYKNVPNFFTLKYIRIIFFMIALFTIAFSIIFSFFIIQRETSSENLCLINLSLFQTTLWLTEIMSIFISLKTLFLKKFGKISYSFLNFESETIKTNDDYYYQMDLLANSLYYNLTYYYGRIEMLLPDIVSEPQLLSFYWEKINVSYINTNYIRNNRIAEEPFPLSINQFLCNSKFFLEKYNLNSKTFGLEKEEYFNYLTYLIIENAYDNILPNLFIKLQTIPEIFLQNNNQNKITIYLMISIYIGFMIIFCILYFLMIHLTNVSMTEVLKKMTIIKIEKIEETLRKIENFGNNIKQFRDREINSVEKEEYDMVKDISNPKKIVNSGYGDYDNHKNLDKNNSYEASSIMNNNGFNTDNRKYKNLTVLNEYLLHFLYFVIILSGFIIPIFIYSMLIIKNINQFLLIEKYIYGRLIYTSLSTLQMKCFISECNTSVTLNYSELQSTSNIQEIIMGIKYFEDIEDFYNNKFLLNACAAAIDEKAQLKRYEICLNESIINSGNNTDNIMKLIDNIIDNIYKKDEMERGSIKTLENGTNVLYFRQLLFNDINFKNIENIFYKYIFSVNDIIEGIINQNLYSYLSFQKYLLVILVIVLALIMVLYNSYFIICRVPKLAYLLNVSRCIFKIVPTSVILNTPELETWIENKY